MSPELTKLRELLTKVAGFDQEAERLVSTEGIPSERARKILANRKTEEYLLQYGELDHFEGVELGSRLTKES